jgi:hypothetical protein
VKNLDWHQAFVVAQKRIAVRRAGWRKWLLYEGTLWHIYTPSTGAGEQHVVRNTEFGADEFLATDWTDEPWAVEDGGAPSDPPPGAERPTPEGTLPPPSRPGGGWRDTGNPSPPEAVNPPPAGGGDTGGDHGSSGDDTPPTPGPDASPSGDPTITVVVHAIDELRGCYGLIDEEPDTVRMAVEVTIAGGTPGVGTLSVVLGGVTKLGTGWPGMNQTFEYPSVTFALGGTVTATVTYTKGGTPYTGTGNFTFPGPCSSS